MGPTILIAIVCVAFFVLAFSLTIIFKGHYMKSEIGENENMRQRGIKCALQEIKEEEKALRGGDCSFDLGGCGNKDCDTCVPSGQ